MYPYQYSWQGMYPYYPVAYRGCPINCPMMQGIEDGVQEDENREISLENDIPDEETRGEGMKGSFGGMKTPVQSMFPSDMMMPGMMTAPEVKRDTFTIVLKQIQAESPEILKALISLGISVETLRQIVFRIIEEVKKEQEREEEKE